MAQAVAKKEMKKEMGRKKYLASFGIFMFIISSFFVNGSITADSLTPSTLHLCGTYPSAAVLTAINVKNNDPINLTDVGATLLISPGPGLIFVTNQTVHLGNIAAFENLSFDPSWNIQCNKSLPGTYEVYISYTGSNDYNYVSFETNSTIIAHTYLNSSDPLLVTNHSPVNNQKIITPYTKLKVFTNREALCRYSTYQNQNYDTMKSFLYTGTMEHEETLTGLAQKPYTYYIKCEESSGAVAEDKVLFNVDLPPTAQVDLSSSLPLKTGITTVTLKTSEYVIEPTLKYVLGNSGPHQIILSNLDSSGSLWGGTLFISNSENWTSGYFLFSATDISGNLGTTITGGKSFLIDSVAPNAPEMLTITRKNSNEVELMWYPKDEDIDHYNIYKVITSGTVGKVYQTTTETTFTDSFSKDKFFYYKISAVDKAGNKGPFSYEVSTSGLEAVGASSIPAESSSPSTQNTTDTQIDQETGMKEIGVDENKGDLVNEIDNTLEIVRGALDEINTLWKNFKENDGEEIQLLDIDNKFKENKVEMMKLIKELGGLKSKDPETIKKGLQEKKEKIESIKKETPSKIQRGEEKMFELNWKEEEIATIIKEFLAKGNINSEKEQEKYISEIKKLLENIQIIAKMIPLTIEYYDGTVKKVSLVSKKISIKEGSIDDVLLLEHIPKSVFSDKKEIIYGTTFELVGPSTLKTNISQFNTFTYSYVINKELEPEKLQETKTILLPHFNEFIAKGKNSDGSGTNILTGSAIFESLKEQSLDNLGIGIILGVIIVIALVVYFVDSAKEKRKSSSAHQRQKVESFQAHNEHAVIQDFQHSPNPNGEKIAAKKSWSVAALKNVSAIFVKNKIKIPDDTKIDADFHKGVSEEIHPVLPTPRHTPPVQALPQMPGASFLYPNHASHEYKKAGLETLKDATVSFLFAEADAHANALNFDQAVKLYHVILANQESLAAATEKPHDSALNKKIPRLHKKLCLLIKVNQLHSCVEKKDYANLKHLLNDAASLYNELLKDVDADEKKFLQSVESYHKVYSLSMMQNV